MLKISQSYILKIKISLYARYLSSIFGFLKIICLWECKCPKSPERAADPPDLDRQLVVSHPTWMLSSYSLQEQYKHLINRAVSPAPLIPLMKMSFALKSHMQRTTVHKLVRDFSLIQIGSHPESSLILAYAQGYIHIISLC